MATRLIGTDDADPRLPALVVAATQGTTAADLAPGDIGQSQTWSSPISSGITVGSGTTTASYARVGDVVHCSFSFTLGTGSAITGEVILNLPVTAAVTTWVNGTGKLNDAGTTAFLAIVAGASTTTVTVRALSASATYVGGASILSATIPFTWVSTDSITLSFTYLAA